MINIRNSQVIAYGDKQSVTVYQDYSDTNKYYIVPVPIIALKEDGTPSFSLVEYDKGDAVEGTCSFQTELHISDEALAAAKSHLGAGIEIGQFDWKSVSVKFHFATAESSALVLIAAPSMYGDNRASFMMHLPDQNTVNDFKNAFGPDGSAGGTFSLEYDVTALTKLPPATVTVEFSSQTAYDYQRTVHVTKDTWGHVTSESVEITEHLQQSQAGTITVDPGKSELDAETKKRLQAWGNATLANDVQLAVQQATKMMDPHGASNFSMSDVASFKNVYIEGQVVDWIIAPTASLPAFDAETWGKVHSKVSNRKFQASFTVQDLTKNGVESIDVAVTYPVGASTPPPNNTFQFTPTSDGSWIFEAPGVDDGGDFDGRFTYTYTVNYVDGTQPYQSGDIQSSDSTIYLTANDLNILQVEFNAENVPFKEGLASGDDNLVSHVVVDFFFVNDRDGISLGMQQASLDATTKSHTFKSKTHMPFNAPYQYRLTYVLVTGEQWVIDWQQTTVSGDVKAGKVSTPSITLENPFQEKTVFLFLMKSDNKEYEMVSINAQYNDEANNLHEQHDWQIQSSSGNPDTWNFAAPNNVNGQVISYKGMYVYDNQPTQLQPAHVLANTILVSPGNVNYGVMVDPSQIAWDDNNYTKAEVNLYTKDDKGTITYHSDIPAFHKDNLTPALVNFMVKDGETPTYYYEVNYYVPDQTKPDTVPETKVTGDTTLMVPAKASQSGAGGA